MTCFATDGFPKVALRCVDMVSDGFQRGFRRVSEGPKPGILICGLRCLYVSLRESSELFQIDVKGVLNYENF